MPTYLAKSNVKVAGDKPGDAPKYHQPGDQFEAPADKMARAVAAGGAELVKGATKPAAAAK